MGIKNKPDIGLLIDAYIVNVDNFIASNGVGAITGPILNNLLNEGNSILTDIKDSYYNLLSETRTAASTSYDSTATTSFWNLPIPTNSKEAHDQEIERISGLEGYPSQNIAYVSNSAILGQEELGNPLRPFVSFSAAILAAPSSNSAVIGLGGSYTEDINIAIKTNFVLNIRNITLNGSITSPSQSSNCYVDAHGALITSSTTTVLAFNASNSIVSGGRWIATGGNATVQTLNGVTLESCYFEQTANQICASGVTDSIANNCYFVANNDFAIQSSSNSYFFGCLFKRNNSLSVLQTTTTECVYKDCSFNGFVEAPGGSNITGRFDNCRIQSPTFSIRLTGEANVFLKDCILIGGTYAVDLLPMANTNPATTQSWFEGCMMFGVTGIFQEPATYNLTGKKVYSINCIYDNTFVPNVTNEQRVFESNKSEIIGLEVPPALTF